MSDHWELFPCQIGEHQAIIAYDHGLREEIDGIAPTSLLKVKATVADPDEAGLPNREEIDRLNALEDGLTAALLPRGAVLVGRVTVASLRIFYYYVDIDEIDAEGIIDAQSDRTGYELRFTLREDAGREGYWQDLYPSRQERQAASDLRVIESLESRGDELTAARRIDHWAYFAAEDGMQAFARWLEAEGYGVESAKQVNPEDVADLEHPWRVVFFNEMVPTIQNVSRVTAKLSDMAAELDGAYDGWETGVVTPTVN